MRRMTPRWLDAIASFLRHPTPIDDLGGGCVLTQVSRAVALLTSRAALRRLASRHHDDRGDTSWSVERVLSRGQREVRESLISV